MKKKVCSITGEAYYGFGNNAYPFQGRCSDDANSRYVVPARLMGITPEMVKKYGVDLICHVIDQEMSA